MKFMQPVALACLAGAAFSVLAGDGDVIRTYTSRDPSRVDACTNAKHQAERDQNPLSRVRGFSACDCSKDGNAAVWVCAVDATFYRP